MVTKLSWNLSQCRTLLTQATTILLKTPLNLSYKVIGIGTAESHKPPIFLLHALLGCKESWKGIGKTILNMTKRSVVIVDIRNHGDSPHINSNKYDEMALDLIHLFNKLEVERASIVGHDIGGNIAMCTSLIQPRRVAGILIIDVSPVNFCIPMKNMLNVLNAMKEVDFKNPKIVSKARKEAFKQLSSIIDDEILECNIKIKEDGTIGWGCNLDVLIKHFKHFLRFPRDLRKKRYNGPCLFIGGQLSEYLPADDLIKIRDMFPNAVVTYIKGTGHNLHIEDPRTFLELAIAFLKTNH